MSAAGNDHVYFHSALFGAVCPEPVRFGAAGVTPVDWEWWWDLERSDVINELAGQSFWAARLDLESAVQPPPCVLTVGADLDDWVHDDHVVHRAVLALRLLGAWSFLDPVWTLRAALVDSMTHRRVGPYNEQAYGQLAAPQDHIDADRAAAVDELVARIEALGVDDLLHPVRALAAPQLPPAARVLIALQLLEGVYGRANRRIGGRSFPERLTTAGVDAETAEWLVDGSDDGGRPVRNAAAHGRDVGGAAADRVVEVTRQALLAFLRTPLSPPEDSSDETDPVTRFRHTLITG